MNVRRPSVRHFVLFAPHARGSAVRGASFRECLPGDASGAAARVLRLPPPSLAIGSPTGSLAPGRDRGELVAVRPCMNSRRTVMPGHTNAPHHRFHWTRCLRSSIMCRGVHVMPARHLKRGALGRVDAAPRERAFKPPPRQHPPGAVPKRGAFAAAPIPAPTGWPRRRPAGKVPSPRSPKLVRDAHAPELNDLFAVFRDLPRPPRPRALSRDVTGRDARAPRRVNGPARRAGVRRVR